MMWVNASRPMIRPGSSRSDSQKGTARPAWKSSRSAARFCCCWRKVNRLSGLEGNQGW